MAGAVNPEDAALPPLREDLQIIRGGVDYSGAPIWIVLDPVRNKFFRVTFELFQLLTFWNHGGTVSRLMGLIDAHFGRRSNAEEISAAVQALSASQLLTVPPSGTWQALHRSAPPRHSLFMRLIHGYLFFKIPLVRPEPFLRATWPVASFLFGKAFIAMAAVAAIVGLYLVSRQWESFVGTFSYVFTPEGLAISFVAIAFIKSMHELGHAYVAHRYGCRVPTMGFAMMVLMPLLYADVTDAWRLRQRRQRLAIDVAGVAVELCIAAFALLLWSFLPDGPLRSAVFILAATGWILSLIVNANPFMRFDGYYIFADFLGVENLQQRAFRHLKWRLKELLFGLRLPPPEQFPARLDVLLTAYAIATAIYRLMLYIGIALLVYHFFIKIVGIGLFAVEIGFFIIRPVWQELKEWVAMRDDIIRSKRSLISLAVFTSALMLLFVPISSNVHVPAITQPGAFVRIYPTEPGRLDEIRIKPGDRVRKGDVLFVISSPANLHEKRLADIEIALAQTRLERIGADADDLATSGPIREQLASLQSKRAGLDEVAGRLVIRAAFGGVIAELNPALYAGRWVSGKERLAYLADDGVVVMRGYVDGESRARIEPSANAAFIPDDLTRPRIDTRLAAISAYGVRALDIPELASIHGGRVAVYQTERRELAPVGAEYAVLTEPLAQTKSIGQTERGVLVIDARPESMMSRLWRWVGRVFVREFGF
jgi:putative peptide zinc metalloprotease protein